MDAKVHIKILYVCYFQRIFLLLCKYVKFLATLIIKRCYSINIYIPMITQFATVPVLTQFWILVIAMECVSVNQDLLEQIVMCVWRTIIKIMMDVQVF